MQLNYLDDEIKQGILSTDSRLRPDMRALESGRIPFAQETREILENRQRLRKSEGRALTPSFFDYDVSKCAWIWNERYPGIKNTKKIRIFET
jgi:hypothetical protein